MNKMHRVCSAASRLMAAGACLFFCICAVAADERQHSDEAVKKSSVVYNLTKFIDWPPDTLDKSEYFYLCMLGDAPFKEALSDYLVTDKHVQGHPVQFKPLNKLADQTCHALFISESEQPRLAQYLAQLNGRPVLTMSDIPGFAEQGGMIGLLPSEPQISFTINLTAAKDAGLKIRAPLLALGLVSNIIGAPR